MAKLELENIYKTYESGSEESFSLNNINLIVEDGELLSILGPSGCGKTTILRIIAGIIKPNKGNVYVDDVDITEVPVEKRGFALVAQQPLLFPNMNVIDNVAFGLKMLGIKKNKRLNEAENILNSLYLTGLEKRFPSQLSGGQKQRVSIARALVIKPKILLMDEPFSALNEELRIEMRELVHKIHKESGITTIFVTHYKDEARFLSDKIINLDKH